MNHWYDIWAMLNTVMIMLALGLAYKRTIEDRRTSSIIRATLGYSLVLPLLGWYLVSNVANGFSEPVRMAMLLCILCAGGTSAGAFVSRVGGSSTLTGTLLLAQLGVSLVAVPMISLSGVMTFGSLSFLQLSAYLILITLVPFIAGMLFSKVQHTKAETWQPRIDKAGRWMTLALVFALTLRYAAEILGGPSEPMLAALLLVVLFMLPPLILERNPASRRTLVLSNLIRNLTLVLSLLAVLPAQHILLPTVLAFGLFMYLASFGLVLAWRR